MEVCLEIAPFFYIVSNMNNDTVSDMINCKFKCMRCGYYFENERPGPTQCPKCNNLYVEWLNWKEVLRELGRDV